MAETRTTLRMSPTLTARLKAIADREHRSAHAQVLVYIERGVAADEAKGPGEMKGGGK